MYLPLELNRMHIQNEQVEERLKASKTKNSSRRRRKRRIFHGNQLNDNLYVAVCLCLLHITYLSLTIQIDALHIDEKAHSLACLHKTHSIQASLLFSLFIFVDASFSFVSCRDCYSHSFRLDVCRRSRWSMAVDAYQVHRPFELDNFTESQR